MTNNLTRSASAEVFAALLAGSFPASAQIEHRDDCWTPAKEASGGVDVTGEKIDFDRKENAETRANPYMHDKGAP